MTKKKGGGGQYLLAPGTDSPKAFSNWPGVVISREGVKKESKNIFAQKEGKSFLGIL